MTPDSIPIRCNWPTDPGSQFFNSGRPVNQQSTNGDSSRAGQLYNGQGFVGVSNDTYGTLTVFRQNALTMDAVIAYDPMAASYAFSPLGFSGVVAGGGYTETARYSTSVKYRINIGHFRAAALWQFGGYSLNNGSRGAWEGQLGGDLYDVGPETLSVGAFFDYNRDAVVISLSGAPTNAQGVPDRNNAAADSDRNPLKQHQRDGGRQIHCRRAEAARRLRMDARAS